MDWAEKVAEEIKIRLPIYIKGRAIPQNIPIKQYRKALLYKELHKNALFFEKSIPNFPFFP